MANADILWLGVAGVVVWWASKGYFGIYNNTFAATGMQGEPVDTAFIPNTPIAGPYSGRVGPTLGGGFHW